MRAEIFYQNHAEEVILLFLLAKADYEEKYNTFSVLEHNHFINQQFKGNCGELCLITDSSNRLIKVFVGTGNYNYNQAMAEAGQKLPPGCYELNQPLPVFALVNWSLAQYRFDRYKKQQSKPKILLLDEEMYAAVLAEAAAIFLIRDLINTPANDMSPSALAAFAASLAKQYDAQVEQWIGKALLEHNFPAIHAVGRAAMEEPRLVSLSWGNPKYPKIVLIGKGVCFDTGGLDIKPAAAMRYMKKDMGGAAHVLGLAEWIIKNKLAIHLTVLIPIVENAVSADSFRPGDIITMRNKLSVEIDNTDAEGRLLLADAIVKAAEANPELIIDFATLTGAARVAVGTEIAAMFCNDEEIAANLLDIAREIRDPIWRLPLYAGYEAMLDSSIADLANATSSPYAGAITAALFLQRFTAANIPWVHFDIMAWNVTTKPGKPEGGEAMAMRTAAHYLKEKYGSA